MIRRRRVLVCGTNYGTRYLQAIEREPQHYQLAGILARGSARSALLATLYGVPLYRRVRDVPAGIDAAIAAMGPAGNRVTIELLRRGVDVLCEHPVSIRFLHSALDTARASGAAFHVNAHFAALPSFAAFIERCRRQSQDERPLGIDARFHPEFLYGFVDVMRHALGPLRLHRGAIAGVPASVQYDASHPAEWRVVVVFPSGALSMLSMAGPVIWNADIRAEGIPLWETIHAEQGLTRAAFIEQRLAALSRSMLDLIRRADLPEQSFEHLSDVARTTERLAKRLGNGNGGLPAAVSR